MTMFRRFLMAGWSLIFGVVLLSGLFVLVGRVPKSIAWILTRQPVHVFLFLFVLVSIIYGVVRIYRQGIKRAKHS